MVTILEGKIRIALTLISSKIGCQEAEALQTPERTGCDKKLCYKCANPQITLSEICLFYICYNIVVL